MGGQNDFRLKGVDQATFDYRRFQWMGSQNSLRLKVSCQATFGYRRFQWMGSQNGLRLKATKRFRENQEGTFKLICLHSAQSVF
jgi:hypothetical protein